MAGPDPAMTAVLRPAVHYVSPEMNILLLGSGGREHALAWKIAASPLTDKLYCAPGNAGIAREADCVPLDPSEHKAVIAFTKDLCKANNIPTAAYQRFKGASAAKDYVRRKGAPIVVKADGLAAGKGVVVAETIAEAEAAVDMMFGGRLGEA